MGTNEEASIVELQQEIRRLLAAAVEADARHRADLATRDERSTQLETVHAQELRDRDRRQATQDAAHAAELKARDDAHADDDERRLQELLAKDVLHAEQIANLRAAIESRDVIGQAKGVIMVSMGCDANEAFELLIRQSQHENRKLIDVATEIANRASRPRPTFVEPQAHRP